MKNTKILALLFMFGFLGTQCTRKPMAGPGGNAVLEIRCQHHGSSIDSATVYIKYNSLEAVALGEYNESKPLVRDSNGVYKVQFGGLKKGEYYLFAQGWDPSILNTVKGGIPFKIETESTFNLIIPVTEVH